MRAVAKATRRCLLLVGALALLSLGVTRPAPATAQPLTPRAALERLFTSERIEPDWFTAAFLAQVPAERVSAIIGQFRETLGAYQRVEPAGEGFEVVFERGSVPARIVLDAQGQISGLRLLAPRLRGEGGVESAVEPFRSLPGQVSVLVLVDGQERVALNAEARLAVGSTFKLAILAALAQQIAAGQRQWSDVAPLDPAWRSLPSGRLQSWPAGTPLTLATLAGQMISESDNTATDALIALVGREAVEAYAGSNRPLLTTREAFVLKNPANADLLARWRAGDEGQRRALLPALRDRPLPSADVFSGGPVALDIEYFFSARELCSLIEQVADIPLTGINPGVASPADWARIAFKGGSEPGVINLTHRLQGADGRRWCVSVTWNTSEPLDDDRFTLAVSSLIGSLAGATPELRLIPAAVLRYSRSGATPVHPARGSIMADVPSDLKYSKEHEWLRMEDGGIAAIGISDFAQDELGDIVYLDIPEEGVTVRQFAKMGEIESVKSVSELFSPISGEVIERNDSAVESPEVINSSPYGEGWLVKVRLADPTELENLLTADDYAAHIAGAGSH